MPKTFRAPEIRSLARAFGLQSDDCWRALIEFALDQAEHLVEGFSCKTAEEMRLLISNRLRMKLEFIHQDSDIAVIAANHAGISPILSRLLRNEFITDDTEGLTLTNQFASPSDHKYIAIVDARGEREARAYFTSWHEIAHILLDPPNSQAVMVRRTPPQAARKDPIEQLVDATAGRLAFHDSLFKPALVDAVKDYGGLGFTAVEAARDVVAPTASIYATAVGSVRLLKTPALFLTAELGYKRDELEYLEMQQNSLFPELDIQPEPKLRLQDVIANVRGQELFKLRQNMRVPHQSIITAAHESMIDVTLSGREDQSMWETSGKGALPHLPLRVDAARRGRYVYGLISARE